MNVIILREVGTPKLSEWEWIKHKDSSVHELEDGIVVRANGLERQADGFKYIRRRPTSHSYVRYETLSRF